MKRLAATLFAGGLWIIACNADSARVCAPGASAACIGLEGCEGFQVCREDSSGFEPCDCSSDPGGGRSSHRDAGDATGGTRALGGSPSRGGVVNLGSGGAAATASGGRVAVGAGGMVDTTAGVIGAACESDADCPGDETYCLTQTSTALLGGGPQGGVCVTDCVEPTDCDALDPPSVCVIISEDDSQSVCLQACALGPVGARELKCRDRVELACFQGFCGPTCENDAACAPQVCDLAWGVCVDPESRPGGGLPIGSACDPSAAEDPCSEFCLAVGDSPSLGVCSGVCNISSFGCGTDLASSAPVETVCLYAASQADWQDAGFCGRLCDCNDDCLHPDAFCEAFPSDSVLAQATGRIGACTIAIDNPDPGIPCTAESDAGAQ